MKKKSKLIAAAIVAAIVLVIAIAIGIYIDYIETREIGAQYLGVFFTDLFMKLRVGAAAFLVALLLFYLNSVLLRKNVYRKIGEPLMLLKRRFMLLFSLIVGAASALLATDALYRKILMWQNGVAFNVTDPVFGKDLSYFFYGREFFITLCEVFLAFAIFLIIYNIAVYFMLFVRRGASTFTDTFRDKGIFVHCALWVFAACVIRAVMYRLTAEGIVYGGIGSVTGAGYTDINVWLPFYKAAPYIIGALVIVAAFFVFRAKFKAAVISVLIFPAALVIMMVAGGIIQSLVVAPREATLEAPFIERNIEFTRMGYNLHNVEVRTFEASDDLTYADIENNRDTINNIRITDLNSTLEVSNSTKSVRSYYVFNDSDIVSYDINGTPTAVNIAARELDTTRLSESANNYINQKFRYTHGYGIVMNPINTVTNEGQPEYIISDMPVSSQKGAPEITEPRIYYGEKTNDYCIVGATCDEFDYSVNEENVETRYGAQNSGIALTPFNRLLFAAKNSDYMLLFSGYINSQSRILPNRNVLARVGKAVPFLTLDNDPYIVIDGEGRLKWVVDLYTTSSKMPYSQYYNGINYIRNSAKAVVDAYTGDVKIYITDTSDALIMTYAAAYKGVFEDASIPSDLEAHLRYPETLYSIQSNIYMRYHQNDAETFYGNSDLWAVAQETYATDSVVSVAPYYNLMSLDDFGEDGSELILMLPYVPANKENLVGWLAARTNGSMILYRFPAGKTVYGTLHIENRISTDSAISGEISLWDQGGSSVRRGNLLVIPIEQSLLYVEPLYITSANAASLPEVKRILVSYNDTVVMEPTLDAALKRLFSVPDKAPTPTPLTQSGDITALFARVKAAQTSGDWEAFGSAMKALEDAVNGLNGGI